MSPIRFTRIDMNGRLYANLGTFELQNDFLTQMNGQRATPKSSIRKKRRLYLLKKKQYRRNLWTIKP